MSEIRYFISDPRQRRALEALVAKEAVSVKEMGPLIGALNPRQTVFQLREKFGLRDAIKTRRFKIVDRDGKVCRPGEYFVSQEDKPLLEELLRKEATKAIGKAKVATDVLKDDVKGGGAR